MKPIIAIFFALVLGLAPFSTALALDEAGEEDASEKLVISTPVAFEKGLASSYLAARYARQAGDFSAAIEYMRSALQRDPDNYDLGVQLLSLQVVEGEIAPALLLAGHLKQIAGGDALGNLLLLVDAVKREEYKEASSILSGSFNESEGQLWLPLVEGWIAIAQGTLDRPMNIEELPISVGRAASIIHYHLALINARAGYMDAAAKNFLASMDENGNTANRIMQGMVHFYERAGKPAILKDTVESYLAGKGDLYQPIEAAVVTPIDGVAEVLYTMGSVMQAAGVSNDAALYFQLARYMRPDFHYTTFALAEILSDTEHYHGSNKVLKDIPPSSRVYVNAQVHRAVNLSHMKQIGEALDVLNDVAAAKRDALEPLVSRGDILRQDKRFLEASIAYSDAIKRIRQPASTYWSIYYSRGACYEQLGRWNDAKADFSKALELYPNQPDVLNYLGYSLLLRGERIAEAKEMLEKAIAQRPNDPHIVDSMGWALYKLGEYDNALPYIERAAELLPDDATVNDHLGDVYYRVGRKDEAYFQWKRALAFNPDEREAALIQKKLINGMSKPKRPPSKSAASSAQPNSVYP